MANEAKIPDYSEKQQMPSKLKRMALSVLTGAGLLVGGVPRLESWLNDIIRRKKPNHTFDTQNDNIVLRIVNWDSNKITH